MRQAKDARAVKRRRTAVTDAFAETPAGPVRSCAPASVLDAPEGLGHGRPGLLVAAVQYSEGRRGLPEPNIALTELTRPSDGTTAPATGNWMASVGRRLIPRVLPRMSRWVDSRGTPGEDIVFRRQARGLLNAIQRSSSPGREEFARRAAQVFFQHALNRTFNIVNSGGTVYLLLPQHLHQAHQQGPATPPVLAAVALVDVRSVSWAR